MKIKFRPFVLGRLRKTGERVLKSGQIVETPLYEYIYSPAQRVEFIKRAVEMITTKK